MKTTSKSENLRERRTGYRLPLTAYGLLVALTACSSAPAELSPAPINLSGTWELDLSRSEFPGGRSEEDVMVDGPPRPRGTRGQAGRGGEGRSPGGRPAGGPGGLSREEVIEWLRARLEGSRTLTIRQTDTTLAITDRESQQRTFHLDGRKVKRLLHGIGELETRARWKDAVLRIEHKLEIGLEVVQKLELSADGDSLEFLAELKGRGNDFEFRRFYGRVGTQETIDDS